MAKKLALLVGCNYTNNHHVPKKYKLHGCINDVNALHALIGCFGFQETNITILTDDQLDQTKFPTSDNIKNKLNQLVDAAKPGDTLLFYFSGGGALVKRPDNPPAANEIKKGISAIIPGDLFPITAGCILNIIKRLPDKAIFTFICDSSYSGGLFDDKVHTESNVPHPGSIFGPKTIPSHFVQPNACPASPPDISLENKILFSSSKANEESVEVYLNRDESKAIGAFSNAIQALLNSPQPIDPFGAGNDLKALHNIWELAAFTKILLRILGFDQHPYINSSDNTAAALFLGNVA